MAWNEVWEKIFVSRPWGKYPSEPLIRYIAKNFYKVPNRSEVKILEVGCGPGRNIWYLARESFSAYGIDGSAGGIEIAKERLNADCPGWSGELRAGDILRLPYADDAFDAVIDSEAICCNNWDDSRKIYQEMWRVTKPGGKMLSITFADDCYGNKGAKGKREFKSVPEGPLAGEGEARFVAYEDVAELISPWHVSQIDKQTYTLDGYKDGILVSEWIIAAEKIAE